ncbi:MAG: EAL domain-containing protein [Terracidiphilus sp.]
MGDLREPLFKQRVLVTVTVAVISAVCGTLVGYLLGFALMLRHTSLRLEQHATNILNEGETSAGEARSVLEVMNASPYSYCSDAEITSFRYLIFKSQYLREAGRMRGGKIDCSSTLGRLNLPLGPFEPNLSRSDGTKIFTNLAPFQVPGQTVISVQAGDSYVVYNPYNRKNLAAPPMHFTVTELGGANQPAFHLLDDSPQPNSEVFTREGQARVGQTLFATRCSVRFSSCMTAYISIPDALQANHGELTAFLFLGGIPGALFGLLSSLFYRRNKSLEQQLRRAIRRDALRVVYQPIVNLASRRIVGAEALVRWTDDDGLAVGPDVFIKIAEDRGFVGDITELVFRHALRSFAEILHTHPAFRLSINIAAADLKDPAFLPMLEQSLGQAGVRAQSLALEITESSTARHEEAMAAIRELRELGYSVDIDDFGTGYSSLSYLHSLSIDAIKIDRSFTQAIGTEAVTLGILPQILAMATALKLQVVVEGIETEQQADYFATPNERTILAQGWLFGRPVTADAFLHKLVEAESEMLVS